MTTNLRENMYCFSLLISFYPQGKLQAFPSLPRSWPPFLPTALLSPACPLPLEVLSFSLQLLPAPTCVMTSFYACCSVLYVIASPYESILETVLSTLGPVFFPCYQAVATEFTCYRVSSPNFSRDSFISLVTLKQLLGSIHVFYVLYICRKIWNI